MKESERLATVQQYRPLIYKTARTIWCQMPHQARAWIGIDDIAEDSLFHIYSTWDPSKGSIANYIITICWRHLYLDYVVMNNRQKRSQMEAGNELVKVELVSIDSANQVDNTDNLYSSIANAAVTSKPVPQSVVSDCEVKRKFEKLYAEAPTELRVYIKRWFLYKCAACVHSQPHLDGNGNLVRDCNLRNCKFDKRSGQAYQRAVKKFRELAAQHNITRDDCAYLMTSRFCSTALIEKVQAAHG